MLQIISRNIITALLIFLIACKSNTPSETMEKPIVTPEVCLLASPGESELEVNFNIEIRGNIKKPYKNSEIYFGEDLAMEPASNISYIYKKAGEYLAHVMIVDADSIAYRDSVRLVVPLHSLILDATKKYQTIEGFGAFGAMDVWWSGGPFYTENFIDLVLNDLGLTILRNNIPWDIEPHNDNNDSQNLDLSRFNLTGVLAKQIPYLKAMKDAGLQKLIISNWTPMDWMKVDIPSDVEPWCDGQCGGKLNPDLYEEYVEYLIAYIKIIKQKCGIDVYALSTQNEPLFEQRTFESCIYTPQELATLIKLFGQRLQKENITTKVFAPEHMGSYDWERGFFDALLIKDPDARQYMYAFAVHSYLDGVAPDYGSADGWQKMYMGAQQYKKQLWMTETSGYQQDWEGAMRLASSIYLALKFGKVSAWVYWQLSESGPSEYALMNGGEPTPLYHISKQFYRFIRPGAIQLESTADNQNILPLLFSHSGDKSYTIVLINHSNMHKSVYIPANGVNQDFESYQTSRAIESSYVRQVYPNGSVYLPAQSITTLYAGPPIPNISPK